VNPGKKIDIGPARTYIPSFQVLVSLETRNYLENPRMDLSCTDKSIHTQVSIENEKVSESLSRNEIEVVRVEYPKNPLR